MILYVNGDSNSAAAEAVNSHAFAEDDSNWNIQKLGRAPHPENAKVSYGKHLADLLGYDLELDAESASSNDRIVRTTYKRLVGVQGVRMAPKPELIIIGWSTWEREEWWDPETNRYWQVNAGGIGHDWPDSIKKRYKQYIANMDIDFAMQNAFDQIWNLHLFLQKQHITHLFFNCFEPLSGVPEVEWNNCYLNPYDRNSTYYNWLIHQGYKTVNPNSYHFGPDAHLAWAKHLYQTLVHFALTKNK